MQVSRLRKALGSADGPIHTRPGGYMLQVQSGELDLERFERLAREGRVALAAGDPEGAAERLREGLELWRGPPLADLAFESFAQPEVSRLEELRLADDALTLANQVGEPAGIADALLGLCGLEAYEPLPQRRRRALATEALTHAREAGDDMLAALALWERALALPPDRGAAEFEEAAAALRKLGSSRYLMLLYSDAAFNAIKHGSYERARPLLELAIPLRHELEDPLQLAWVYGNVGFVALFTGDLDRAQIAFCDQLRLCREYQYDFPAAIGLAGVAAIATRQRDPERAARLLGAASMTGPWDADGDVAGQLEHHFFAPARAHYGERPWDEGRAAGTRMSVEEGIVFALSSEESAS